MCEPKARVPVAGPLAGLVVLAVGVWVLLQVAWYLAAAAAVVTVVTGGLAVLSRLAARRLSIVRWPARELAARVPVARLVRAPYQIEAPPLAIEGHVLTASHAPTIHAASRTRDATRAGMTRPN